MSVLYLVEDRASVRIDAETLVIQYPENKETKQMARKQRVPLMKVSQVVIYGNITMTTPAIQALMEQKAEICYLNRFGRFVARVSGDDHKHGNLRLLQRRAHDNPTSALHVAAACVRAKLHNQRTLLLRANRQREDSWVADAAEQIKRGIEAVDALPTEDHVPENPTRPQAGTVMGRLNGIEGAAGKAYFEGYALLFNGAWAGVMNGRSKRPPTDAVNALLSYGYTLLATQTTGAAHAVGFDPYIGFMHSTVYGRPALALDIMEMFRVPIVDSVVLNLLNNRMLTLDDFEESLGSWRMTDAARKLFLTKFEERMNEQITHPVLKIKVSYRRCIDLQFRLLSRWLLGEVKRVREFYIR